MKKFLLLMIIPFCIPPPSVSALNALAQNDAALAGQCKNRRSSSSLRTLTQKRLRSKKRKRILHCVLSGVAITSTGLLLTLFYKYYHTKQNRSALQPTPSAQFTKPTVPTILNSNPTAPPELVTTPSRNNIHLEQATTPGLSPIPLVADPHAHTPPKLHTVTSFEHFFNKATTKAAKNSTLYLEQTDTAQLLLANVSWLAGRLTQPQIKSVLTLAQTNINICKIKEFLTKIHTIFFPGSSLTLNDAVTKLIEQYGNAQLVDDISNKVKEGWT